MTKIQIIPGSFNITDPDWPAFDFWPNGGIVTSDSFSGSGGVAGRYADAAAGGISRRWSTSDPETAWHIEGGTATLDDTSSAGFRAGAFDYATTIKIAALPEGASGAFLGIQNRRTAISSDVLSFYVELRILATGSVRLSVFHAGNMSSVETITTVASACTAGDEVTLRTVGDTADILINGEVLTSRTIPVGGMVPGWSAVRAVAASTAPSISEYRLEAVN